MSDDLVDIELEMQAICSIFADNSLIDDLVSKCSIDHFTHNISEKSYDWIKEQYSAGKPVNRMIFVRECDVNVDKLVQYGTREYEYDTVLRLLEKYRKRRWLMGCGRELVKLAKDNSYEPSEYETKAQDIVFSEEKSTRQDKKIFDMGETLEVVFEHMTKIENDEELQDGLPTGYPSIDSITGGMYRGNMIVVAAPTSMGKSAFALNVAYHLLMNNKKIVYVSLEMPVLDMAKRLLALDSNVPLDQYKKKLQEYQQQNVNASMSRLIEKNWRLSTKRSLGTVDIKAICRKLKKEMGGVDLIIVDYLQNIKMSAGKENTAKKVGLICKELFNLAGELDTPLMLLSQVSRKRNGVPKLSDLRDSGEIEETADDIWFPYRPDYEEGPKKEPEKEKAKLYISKNRNGRTGIVDMVWYPQIVYFRDDYVEEKEGPLELIQ